EPLLSARHDQDLLGAAASAAGGLHVLGDRLTQRAETGRLAVVELRRGDRPEATAREAPPEADREQVHAGGADAERPRRTGEPARALGRRHQRRAAPRQRGMLQPTRSEPGPTTPEQIVG